MKIIRVMCTGRVDVSFILRAFSNDLDGVFIGGCWLGECHYLTEGNHAAVSTMHLTRKLLKEIGVSPERVRLESISASEGARYAELVTDFVGQIKDLGPLGTETESADAHIRKMKLKAATDIVPYLRLVERERLRIRFDTREEYDRFFAGEEVDRILSETVIEELRIQEILMLLREKPLSIDECAHTLGLSVSQVSRYLNLAAKKRLTRFDESEKRFALV